MEFLFLVLIFIVLGLVLSAAWYLLPYLLIFWAVLWVIRYFQNRKIRRQLESQGASFYSNPFGTASTGHADPVQTRKPKTDSIDVEYIEYDDPGQTDALDS